MANEITAVVAASSTGVYALVRNPTNRGQAWDVTAGAWATYDRTDSDQQIALGSAIAIGASDEEQFANLPAALSSSVVYEFDVYDSTDERLSSGLTRLYTDANGYALSDLRAIGGSTGNATNLGTAASNYSATRGLAGTALPAVEAAASGGLPTVNASNQVEALLPDGHLTAAKFASDAITADKLATSAATKIATYNPAILARATVATKTSSTVFTIQETFQTDDAINGKLIRIGSELGGDPGIVADFAEATQTITLASAMVFEVGDVVVIYAQDSASALTTAMLAAGFSTESEPGAIEAAIEDLPAPGTTQPRINYEPGIKLKLSSRRDGTYTCDRPVRLLPGTFDVEKTIGIDTTKVFGSKVQVATVGTPAVSGGSITATELGPRDQYAMVQLDGTATASESRTVDVPLTMDNGDQITARFEIEVGE